MQAGSDNIRRLIKTRKKSSIVVNSPLSDTIARIKNGYMRQHMDYVYLINTNFVRNVVNKLSELRYIGSVEIEGRELKVALLKGHNKTGIDYIKCITTPGRRLYISYRDMPRSKFGVAGEFLLSTNRGIITDREAKLYKVGGELLLEVYSCQKWMQK